MGKNTELFVIDIVSSGHNLGKWTAGDNSSGTDLGANSGVVEDYDEDEDSGSCRTYSHSILSYLLINLSIFLFLHVTTTSMSL